jgi:hypothetical protein
VNYSSDCKIRIHFSRNVKTSNSGNNFYDNSNVAYWSVKYAVASTGLRYLMQVYFHLILLFLLLLLLLLFSYYHLENKAF